MRQATKWGVNAGVAVAGQDNGRLPGPTGKRSRHDPSPFFLSPLSVPTRADRKNEWTRSDCQQQPSASSRRRRENSKPSACNQTERDFLPPSSPAAAAAAAMRISSGSFRKENPPRSLGLASHASDVSYVASVGATIGDEGPELPCGLKKKKKKTPKGGGGGGGGGREGEGDHRVLSTIV